MDVLLSPKSKICEPVVAPNRKFPFDKAPEDAGSAGAATTSNLLTGVVVPMPVWEKAQNETNKRKTIFFTLFLSAVYLFLKDSGFRQAQHC